MDAASAQMVAVNLTTVKMNPVLALMIALNSKLALMGAQVLKEHSLAAPSFDVSLPVAPKLVERLVD